MISYGGEKCLYYTGIASSYSGLPASENKAFIEASYSAGTCGYVIFSGAQIVGHADVQSVLSSGVNCKSAVLPHAEISKILKISFDDIISKAERLYIPAGAMTESDKISLEDEFDKILELPDTTNEELEVIYQSVLQILNNVQKYASGYAKQRISEDLDYLTDILKARSLMPIVEDDPTGDDDVAGDDDVTGDDNDVSDNENNDENKENAENPTEKLGFFAALIQAIILFFKRLFGLA